MDLSVELSLTHIQYETRENDVSSSKTYPIKCHSRDPAETDRRRLLSKSLRRNVKMTVRIISFELGSVAKATHCRLFHVRHLSKTVLSSTILSSSSCPSLAKSDPFHNFLRLILPKSSIISKQKIYSSLLILCWVNPYHRWNLSTFNERRKYLIS